jgi:hypothetical protein
MRGETSYHNQTCPHQGVYNQPHSSDVVVTRHPTGLPFARASPREVACAAEATPDRPDDDDWTTRLTVPLNQVKSDE